MKLPKIQWKNTERNRIIALAVFMIIALSAVSLWQRNVPAPKKVTFGSDREMAAAVAQTDLQANDQIMKDIVDKTDLATDLAKQFGMTQTITMVQIQDSKLNGQPSSQENIQAYINKMLALVTGYNNKVAGINDKISKGTATGDDYDTAYAAAKDTLNELYAIKVPSDAFAYHKDAINMFLANQDLFSKSKLVTDDAGWKYSYKDYAIMELAATDMQAQYDTLKQKYKLE